MTAKHVADARLPSGHRLATPKCTGTLRTLYINVFTRNDEIIETKILYFLFE